MNADERRWIRAELKRVDEICNAHFEATDKALTLARVNMERRLTQMNELRDQINAERGHYLTREFYDHAHEQLEQLVREVERKMLPRETFETQSAEWTRWRQSIDKRGSEAFGQRTGITMSARALAGTIGAIASLLVIIVTVLAANGRLG